MCVCLCVRVCVSALYLSTPPQKKKKNEWMNTWINQSVKSNNNNLFAFITLCPPEIDLGKTASRLTTHFDKITDKASRHCPTPVEFNKFGLPNSRMSYNILDSDLANVPGYIIIFRDQKQCKICWSTCVCSLIYYFQSYLPSGITCRLSCIWINLTL